MAETADEKRQEFVPKEEASVLPKYLDNVDAEIEGTLVTFPIVKDDGFNTNNIKRIGILDFGDEGMKSMFRLCKEQIPQWGHFKPTSMHVTEHAAGVASHQTSTVTVLQLVR